MNLVTKTLYADASWAGVSFQESCHYDLDWRQPIQVNQPKIRVGFLIILFKFLEGNCYLFGDVPRVVE